MLDLQIFTYTGPLRLTMLRNESTENETIRAGCCVDIAEASHRVSIVWFLNTEPFNLPNNTLIEQNKKGDQVEVCSSVSFRSHRRLGGLPLVCLVPNGGNRNRSTSVLLKVMCKLCFAFNKYKAQLAMTSNTHLFLVQWSFCNELLIRTHRNKLPIIICM